MIDKRKKRKQSSYEPWKPTQDELEVAKFLYRKLPTTDGRLGGSVVRAFSPQEAIDMLLDSVWAKVQPGAKNPKPRLFNSPAAAVSFMNTLIQKQMFYRAIKVKRKLVPQKQRTADDEKSSTKTKCKKRSDDSKNKDTSGELATCVDTEEVVDSTALPESPAEDKASVTGKGSNVESTCKTSGNPKSQSSSSSKPVRLEMSNEQTFVVDDPSTVYVWVYEPPPGLFNWLAGTAVIIGIILCCLFPIWPTELRTGAYYLTILASLLFGLLLVVALIRFLLYLSVWLVTMGKYTFWLFPNYFEDCGFFESFRPVYTLMSTDSTSTKSSKEKKSRLKPATTSNGSAKLKNGPLSVAEPINTEVPQKLD
ncbi:hypothetical protein T265_13830 [Opisthorchis viverrini]|uniref:Translocation protein SEC62 n=1 Tax=Opisthorchis viverrini TaxID=6198 RepID=A0A074ZV83_OPIVI|nr:hypothetical protein T265_13830 [Opisthorchis viverrini]KER27275.1 hypothetical protein T265_13830 [Opisthorchis viverrini]